MAARLEEEEEVLEAREEEEHMAKAAATVASLPQEGRRHLHATFRMDVKREPKQMAVFRAPGCAIANNFEPGELITGF